MTALLESLHRIAFLWRKEFLAILKDPSSRAILLVPAIVQSMIFGYVATYDLRDVPYALLDQSHGGAAQELVARFDGTGVFHRIATLRSNDDIVPAVEQQGALVVLQIGPRFEAQLQAGENAPLQVILDARNSNTAGSAARFVSSVVSDFNADWRARHGGPPVPIAVELRAWFNPNLETRWFILPGLIAGISMIQTLLLTALSVSREREQGTFDQLLVTPLTPSEIMVGKALPPVVVGLVQSTLILLVSIFWFRIPLAGSLLTLYAGLAMFTIASVGIGLSISALSGTMQQATLYTFVLVMPLMLLSGIATPVANMPEVLQVATMANPLRFAIDLVQRVYLEGAGMVDVWRNLIPMLVIAALTLPLASWLFRHKLS
jgi:ABC-2 type transport system permease protein